MKKLFTILTAAILLSASAWGQDVRVRLQENPGRYANPLHSYEPPETVVDTPAPDGLSTNRQGHGYFPHLHH